MGKRRKDVLPEDHPGLSAEDIAIINWKRGRTLPAGTDEIFSEIKGWYAEERKTIKFWPDPTGYALKIVLQLEKYGFDKSERPFFLIETMKGGNRKDQNYLTAWALLKDMADNPEYTKELEKGQTGKLAKEKSRAFRTVSYYLSLLENEGLRKKILGF